MDDTFICDCCGERFPERLGVEVNDEHLCEQCANEETVICSHCGERIYRNDNAGDESVPLCQRCYYHYYTTCTRCGRIIHIDDAYYEDDDNDEPYCYDCHTAHSDNQPIHSYYYKPEPLFRGDGNRYFGIELEIDKGGELNSSAEEILSAGNSNGLENIYIKRDGSLDDGMEIVSHPFTLEYHLTEMPWKNVLDTAKSLGYKSHQCQTAGLHIHVNRNAFGDTEEEQDACIARILYFFEKHWEELLKFSRRTAYQLNKWAARYGYKEQPKEILDHAKKGACQSRYACVNLQNYNTIEFSIFRGTLKLNTLIAALQLINIICDAAVFMSDDSLKGLSWTTFVSEIQKDTYPELIRYLKERRLYINDTVVGEEEV